MAKVNLTTGKIASFSCDKDKQEFLWDSATPGLAVRATASGKKAFIVESRFTGKTIRLTIGDVGTIALNDARNEARRLLLLIKQGIDPREQKRKIIAEQEQAKEARKKKDAIDRVKAIPFDEAWQEYLAERKPFWSNGNYLNHVNLSQAPGGSYKRGNGMLKDGPIYHLMHQRYLHIF